MIITSTQKHVINGDIIHLEQCSTSLTSTLTLFLIASEELNALSVTLSNSATFSLYTIDAGTVQVVTTLDTDNVTPIYTNSQFIYKLNVLFTSTEEIDDSVTLNIVSDNDNLQCDLVCSAIALDEKLLITLQNLKQVLSDDYMIAFRDTVVNSNDNDNIIYNRKVKEYLLGIFELSALSGTYTSLNAILNFFGYGELLAIKEYWTNNSQYKSTSIANAVLSKIDKQLIGYRKTNQLSLVYQINEETGSDAYGLPLYSNVFANTDAILVKLWAVERILEKDFLFLNTHIVDVIGEFQSVVGLELSAVLNDTNVTTINLTDNLNSEVKFKYVHNNIHILRHDVIVKPFVFDQISSTSEIERITSNTYGHFNQTYFDIIRKADALNEFDALTKLYVGDFGLVEIEIEFDKTRYQTYKTVLLDSTGAIAHVSLLHSVNDIINNTILYGIKTVGSYKLLIYLIDNYGGATIVANNDFLTISNEQVDFFIAKYDYSGTLYDDLSTWSTYERTSGSNRSIVVNNISDTLDVNTWNPQTNSPPMQIARFYASDFDQYAKLTNLNQLNSIPLNKLNGLPLTTWGQTHTVFMFDPLGNYSEGMRSIGLRNFDTTDFDKVEKYFSPTSSYSDTQWLTSFVSDINAHCLANPASTLNDFTWDMHYYANSSTADFLDAKPLVRAKSVLQSYATRFVHVELVTDAADYLAPTGYVSNDVQTFTHVDATVEFYITDFAISDLLLIVDSVEHRIQNLAIGSILDAYDTLYAFTGTISGLSVTYNENTNSIIVFCSKDISISHDSIGLHSDIARGIDSSKIIRLAQGSDIRLGEPVFAFIDSDSRLELSDIRWTLTNALTGTIVSIQNGYAFRWFLSEEGSYTLRLECLDYAGNTIISEKSGCIIVPVI